MRKVNIGKTKLALDTFKSIVYYDDCIIELDKAQLARLDENYEFLKSFSADKVIYGVNTGFGPMAQYIIPHEDRQQLQYNLIHSHASGMGEKLDALTCRAIAVTRLSTLMTARSGIHSDTAILLRDMIQKGIYPVIYSHGGVGASGDLVQLAHLALGMLAEGQVHYKGEVTNATAAFEAEGLEPMKIKSREGLALMNGTSAMTAIGMLNILRAKRLLRWSISLSSMINEIVESFDDHLSALLNEAKHHPGQRKVAAAMRALLEGSKCIKIRSEVLYKSQFAGDKLDNKLQEYYSIRCVPQILGPIHDTLENAEFVLGCELNSTNDNPLIFDREGEIFHGGNFHGDYVSLEMDKIKIAVTKLSMLAERQLNYLLNDRLNESLTPFINSGRLGFNFGLQGCQFVATSTVAENQTLSNPMYVHSIPCNNDNQDIVSMGTNAALMASRVIENTFDVLSIEVMAVVHAIAFLKTDEKMAPKTKAIYDELKGLMTIQADDFIPSPVLASIKARLKNLIDELDEVV